MAPAGRSSHRSAAGDKKRRRNDAQSTHWAVSQPQLNFTVEDVLRAVSSLYDDQLRPSKWLLRKRLAEQVEAVSTWPKDHDSEGLRLLCQSIEDLHVESEEGEEWFVLLLNRAPDFVEIYDKKDPYPEEMWTAAHAYFLSLGRNGTASLPRGRYASAQELVARCLPFLAGFTLGQVCHIVQLAVSQRRLLGYTNSNVVAFEHSICAARLHCIQQQQQQQQQQPRNAMEGVAGTCVSKNFSVADWCTARDILREILEWAVLRGNDSVQLANVKRLFRSVYAVDLNETALGHCKLSELLQDERFRDICEVQLRCHGYVVVPAKMEDNDHEEGNAHPLSNHLNSHTSRDTNETAAHSCSNNAEILPPVQHTFIHFRLPPPTPPTTAAGRRSRSVPGDRALFVPHSTDGCLQGTPVASHGAVQLAQQKKEQRTENEVVNDLGLTSSIFIPSESAAATPIAQHCQHDAGGDHAYAWEAMCHALGMTPTAPMAQECIIGTDDYNFQAGTNCPQETGHDRVQFCLDEPLHLCEAECTGSNSESILPPGVAEPAPHFFPIATPSPLYEAADASYRWRLELSIKKKEEEEEEDSFRFCQDEPLCLEDAMPCDASDKHVPWASPAFFARTPSPRYTCLRSPWEQHNGSSNAVGFPEGGSCELAQGTLNSPSSSSTSAGSRTPSVTSEEVLSTSVAGLLPEVSGAAAALVCEVEQDAGLAAGIWDPNASCTTHLFQPQVVATPNGLGHGEVDPSVAVMFLATTTLACRGAMAVDDCHGSLGRLGTNMLPPPPMHPPVFTTHVQQHVAPPPPVAPNAEESPTQPTCILRLSDLVQEAEVSSLGSENHSYGKCRPCAHFHTRHGCRSGASCTFCHRCPPGELKRRQRVKRTTTQQCPQERQQQRLQQRLEELQLTPETWP